MCVAELQRELRRRSVNATGEKALLVKRLEQALAGERKSTPLVVAAAQRRPPASEPPASLKRRAQPKNDYADQVSGDEDDDSLGGWQSKQSAAAAAANARERTPKQRRTAAASQAPSTAPQAGLVPSGARSAIGKSSRAAALADEMATLLSAAQQTSAHGKHVDELEQLFRRTNRGDFTLAFVTHLDTIVACDELDAKPAARLFELVALFCNRVSVAHKGVDVLLSLYIIDLLRRRLDVQDKTVRLRSCQLLTELLAHLPAGAAVPPQSVEELYQALESRTLDRFATVRLAAVRTLARLQSSLEPVCARLRELLGDANVEVRLAAAEVLLLRGDAAVDAMLVRTRDSDARVRRVAVDALLRGVELRSLHRPQRVQLVANVLDERTETAREAAMALLHERWLAAQCDGNVERLLRTLTVSESAHHTDVGLKLLHELLPLLDQFDPVFDAPDKLTAERALIWRAFADLYGSSASFTPELSRFAELVRVNQANEFVAVQLLHTCRSLDLQDEVGRRKLNGLLRGVLSAAAVPVGVLPAAMLLLRDIANSLSEFCDYVVEAIAEIREPLDFHDAVSPPPTTKPPILALTDNARPPRVDDNWVVESPRRAAAGAPDAAAFAMSEAAVRALDELRGKLALLVQKKNELVAQERFERAAAVKSKCEEVQCAIDELREREAEAQRRRQAAEHQERAKQLAAREGRVLSRCLAVVEQLFGITSAARSGSRGTSVDGLLASVIAPALTHRFPAVRAPAMRALGLYCMQSGVDEARRFLSVLMSAVASDRLAIRADALRAIVDLICVHKLDALCPDAPPPSPSPPGAGSPKAHVTRAALLERLVALLSGRLGVALACVAAEGMAKLLHLGLLSLDGVDRGVVDEAFVLLVTRFASWSRPREASDANDDDDAADDDRGAPVSAADDAELARLAAGADDDVVEPRVRAVQLLAVFFSAAERNARLCVVAARNVLEVLRRSHFAHRNVPSHATATAATTCALQLANCAPPAARLACSRLLLAEILANPTGGERQYVKFLSHLPPVRGDDAAELARLRALTQMCKSEVADRALGSYEKLLEKCGAGELEPAEMRKITEFAKAHRTSLFDWLDEH
jgi:hypothetical protein